MSGTSRLKASRLRLASLAAAGLALGVLASAGLSCTVINQNHCFFADGKCDAGLVCDSCSSVNNGCVVEVSKPSCLISTGATMGTTDPTATTTDSTTTEDPTTTTTLDPTTVSTSIDPSETTETVSDPTEPPFACEPGAAGHQACAALDPTTPYCWKKDTCGACDDFVGFSCIDATNDAAPACESGSGLCVECTPEYFEACLFPAACNGDTFTCGACTEHYQCETGACNLATGKCVPASATFWVENRQGCHTEGNIPGTKENPWCWYYNPLDELQYFKLPELALFILPGTGTQDYLQFGFNWDRTLILIGVSEEGKPQPALKHTWQVVDQDPIFYVNGGLDPDIPSRLIISNMDIRDATTANAALTCEGGGEIWIDDSRFTNNRIPFTSSFCKYHIRRSTITGNAGGLNLLDSQIDVENSYFTGNTLSSNEMIRLVNTDLKVVYSTFVANTKDNLPVLGIRCGNLASTLSVRNSVLLGAEPYLLCGKDGDLGDDGGNFFGPNEIVLNHFNMPVQGVYRPKMIAEFKDTATWLPGDPYRDFDGDKRPAVEGATDFSGADRP